MNEALINDWQPETKSLIATLKRAGIKIVGGDNGEETFKPGKGFLANLLACDEAHLYIECPNGSKVALYLVLGNSPGELVSDYGIPRDAADSAALDKATDEHNAKWDGRKQPTKPNPYYKPVDYVLTDGTQVFEVRKMTFNEAAVQNSACFAVKPTLRSWTEKSFFDRIQAERAAKTS